MQVSTIKEKLTQKEAEVVTLETSVDELKSQKHDLEEELKVTHERWEIEKTDMEKSKTGRLSFVPS